MLRSAPYMMVGLTASAALAAVVLLAAEDRALFEPLHAVGWVDEVGAEMGFSGAATAPPLLRTQGELRSQETRR